MDNITDLIKNKESFFSNVDRQLAQYVLKNHSRIPSMSIVDLANVAFVSTSSVLRFTQKLGFKGFSDFKYSINWNDSDKNTLNQADAELLGNSLTKLINNLSTDVLSLTFNYIKESHRTFILATGLNQQDQARDLQQQFLLQNINMVLLPSTTGSELNKQIAASVTANDLIIIFSSSGENEVVKDFLKLPILTKTPVISFTNDLNNWLAMHSNCVYSMDLLENEDLFPFYSGYFHLLINYLGAKYHDEFM